MNYVLVTGGAGYIGSHATLSLLEAGYDVLVIDNFCNSSGESLKRVSSLAGRSAQLVVGDIRDESFLNSVFSSFAIQSVLHFAGLKAVGDSVSDPISYYENNVSGTLSLCKAMSNANVYRLVFSSSATVYGIQSSMPLNELSTTSEPSNPYGKSKLMAEYILKDLAKTDPRWSIALLRYFNPVGAHESGFIGEDPKGAPNNLLPYISQVASGRFQHLMVFGNDYPTPDGTGIRDYIHVVDLTAAHLKALEVLQRSSGVKIWNIGTGKGFSVLEVIRSFEAHSGRKIPFKIAPRREGDVAECWANVTKAMTELDWRPRRGLSEMMRDAWNWQSRNPNGYS